MLSSLLFENNVHFSQLWHGERNGRTAAESICFWCWGGENGSSTYMDFCFPGLYMSLGLAGRRDSIIITSVSSTICIIIFFSGRVKYPLRASWHFISMYSIPFVKSVLMSPASYFSPEISFLFAVLISCMQSLQLRSFRLHLERNSNWLLGFFWCTFTTVFCTSMLCSLRL